MSGTIPRAPLRLRRLGLEWLFRLLVEPMRLWRRYLIGNPLFLMRVLGRKLARGSEAR
jgi:UDP-N-acetyl-D-mannosaminuronic acid transferase (WecB/TagA/CpsF family)